MRLQLAGLLVAAAALGVLTAIARAGGDDALRAERLAHLLAYVDADYGRVGAAEQREHLAMLDAATRIAHSLRTPTELERDIARVGALVEDAAPAAEVHGSVAALRASLLQDPRIERVPRRALDAARGRALYERHCAACHGVTGRADTPVAATLRPHPANFRDALFGETLSPYQVTTAIRFGIDGTPMAPVSALDEAERWDVAFYVLGLRHPGPHAGTLPQIATRELAGMDDRTLRETLFASGIGGARLEPTMNALRRLAPFSTAGDWPAENAAPATAAIAPQPQGPCSEPGFGPGPELHVVDGGLPFDVTHDCMFPAHARLEITANLRQTDRPRRAQVDALLRELLAQVKHAEGDGMPELTHICVFARGTTSGEGAYGCLQLEADEGPQGELAVQVDLPFEAEEWARTFAEARTRNWTGSLRPTVRIDAVSGRIEVVYPFDALGQTVTVAQAAVHLFPWLFDFYPPRTELQAITVVGVAKGKTVLEIRVADLTTFLAMDPWAIRERMAAAGIPIEPGAARSPAQEAVLEAEYVRALAKLPR